MREIDTDVEADREKGRGTESHWEWCCRVFWWSARLFPSEWSADERPVQNRLANVQSGHQWCIQTDFRVWEKGGGASTPTRPLKKVKCSLVFDNETQDFNMNLLVFYLINFQLFRRYARRTAYECAPEGNYTYILPSCRRISFASQFYFNSFSLGDFLSRSAHAAQCITHYEYICCGSVFVYLSVCHTYILRWIPCVRGASQNIKLLIIIEWNWSEK